MSFIGNVINNQFLFYTFLIIFCIGAVVLLTLIYLDRRNLKSFKREEKNLLKELETLVAEEDEVKITQIDPKPEEKKQANLEEVLQKMQADLEKKEDVVATFEQEQEEKAIISYQELLKTKNKNVEASNKELLSVIEQIKTGNGDTLEGYETVAPDSDYIEEPIHTQMKQSEEKKFKTTDFISPIYGKLENHIEYPKIPNFNEFHKERKNSIELDQKIDNLEGENNHNDAFLNALKEFRSHLE